MVVIGIAIQSLDVLAGILPQQGLRICGKKYFGFSGKNFFFHFSRIFHWHAKASWDELSESTDPEDRVVDSDDQAMVVDVD